MTRGIDWVTPEEADRLIHLGWFLGSAFIAFCGREYGQLWKRRYENKAAEAAELQDTLADARYRRSARQQPLDIPELMVDDAVGHPRRRHWHTRLSWPGLNAGVLPVAYGDVLDADRLGDPCLAPAIDADELIDWLAEPQAQSFPPLSPGELLVEQALVQFEATPTQKLETIDAPTPRR